METVLLRNFINGEWIESATGNLLEQRNPADLSQVTSRFQRSSREEARDAIEAAQDAFIEWSGMPAPKRAELLSKALAAIVRRREEFAKVLTHENGKTIRESLTEIDSAIKEMDWQIAEGRRLYGETIPSEREGVFAYSFRQPLGVVSIISPWNFPFNVPGRKCTPALMAGNTLVLKPASLTPRTGVCFVEAFEEAGLPPGVINLVTGDGSTVGDELVINPKIRAISFTGSTPVGMGIHKKAAETLAKTQLEMGGKNPIVVLADADLDAAADATALAAYACAGQWCTSTSRAVVEANVFESFQQKVADRVAGMRVGNGLDPNSNMGPVCGEAQFRDILRYIELGISEGAKLVAGGRQLTEGELARGCFIEPTVFSDVTPDMKIAREEIFGPVLAMIRVDDFEQAVKVANAVEFGLCSSIYTSSIDKALTFIERTEVGLTHVNMPSAHKEPQLSFGGIKHSGAGLPEAGKTGIEFFSQHKVAYIKYR
ncbi:MAG: aldehyde dehydrogenase family protein [Armatimonadetes bacterium]|nr:aldehyde dehydrogenase family protein [Armatimonadota bacterium]